VSLRIAVILGSVRSQRIGHRVARFVDDRLKSRGHIVTVLDPLAMDLPLLDKMYKEYPAGSAPANLEYMAQTIQSADGCVVVSAEYNHSIPPGLSNLMAHFLEEYFWKPSGIVCYSVGPFGGVRAAMQLRAMLAELGTPSIPSLLPFPQAHEMLDEDGRPTGDRPGKSADRFFAEFEWYAQALKAQRASGTPY
jgi:NAD(P)H-dependent FMN reductase